MLFLRKIIFYSFLVSYLVFCPLILLYAFGFIFKPGAKQGVVKTGLIYLESAPAGASVYLGSSLYTQKTPATLGELIPGTYKVTLSLQEYLRWTKEIEVQANKAVIFDKVILVPNKWKSEELQAKNFKDMVPVLSSDSLILCQNQKVSGYYAYIFATGKLMNLFSNSSIPGSSKVKQVFKVDSSSEMIFEIDGPRDKQFIKTELVNQEIEITDISQFISQLPSQLQWDPQDSEHIFSLLDSDLNRIDLGSSAVYPEYFQRVRGYGIFNRKLYVLDELNTLRRMNYDKGFPEYLLKDPILGKFLFQDKHNVQVKPFLDNVIVFLDDSGELVINRLPHRFSGLQKGVLGVSFDPKGNRLLLWKKDSLGILDFSAQKLEDTAFQKGVRLYWPYRQGRNISQAFWVFDYSHILFRDGDAVFLLEVLPHGVPELVGIVKVKKGSSIYYSEKSGTLYYLERSKGTLNSILIVPTKNLIGQVLPKKIQNVVSQESTDDDSQ